MKIFFCFLFKGENWQQVWIINYEICYFAILSPIHGLIEVSGKKLPLL